MTKKRKRKAAVSCVEAFLLPIGHIKHCLVHVKVGRNKVWCDLVFIAEDEVVETYKQQDSTAKSYTTGDSDFQFLKDFSSIFEITFIT